MDPDHPDAPPLPDDRWLRRPATRHAPGMRIAALGPFALEEPLARGGQGQVWLARHTGLGLPVAIKLARAGIGSSATKEPSEGVFAEEVRTIAGLDHPHVAMVFDHG